MGREHQQLLVAVVGAALIVTQAGRFFLGDLRGGVQPLLLLAGMVAVAGVVASKNWGRRLLLAVMGIHGAGAILQMLRPPRLVNGLVFIVSVVVVGWLMAPGMRSIFTSTRRNWGMVRVTSGMLLLVAKIGTWVSPSEVYFRASSDMEATGMLLGSVLSICFAVWLVWSGVKLERAAAMETRWS